MMEQFASMGYQRTLPIHCTLRYGTLLMVPQAKLSYGSARQDGTLKGAPIWGPPLPHPLSMVQSDVKRFEICGYKLFE